MQPCKRRRAGCTECRRKKAKCDEKRPACSRCSNFPQLCSYDLNIKQSQYRSRRVTDHFLPNTTEQARKTVDEEPCSNLEPWSPILSTFRLTGYPMGHSDSNRFYLHHFIAHTSMVYFPLRPETTLSLIIPTAQENPFMLEAIVAASCSHYCRLTGNERARTAAIAATVGSLSTLRDTITTPTTASQSSAMLSTMLLLATTCVCAGDTAAFRKHLDGALHIVEHDSVRHASDALWWLSLKWLVHLLLMNRLSELPLTTRRRKRHFDWDRPLASMPDFGQIDVLTGLSRDLVNILEGVCGLCDPNCSLQNVAKPCMSAEDKDEDGSVDEYPVHQARTSFARSLERRLLKLKDIPSSPIHDLTFRTELECCHSMFANATLLCLYRRVDELPKTHPKVQLAVDFITEAVQKIDKRSRANIQLLWPLLTAGCEAITDTQRSVIEDRIMAMSTRGHGSYNKVIWFMKLYWEEGGDSRWDVFSRQIGVDLILF